jgi:acetyl esterase
VPVDPLIAPLLAALNAQPAAPLDVALRRAEAARRQAAGSPYGQFTQPLAEVADVHEERIPVTSPTGEITVRIYRNADVLAGAPAGALVVYHGGGWIMGSLGDSDPRSRTIAAAADVVVVSADYRLAPEFPFPTPVHDCYDALTWTVANAGRLGFDPRRIGVAGESAGANLAAAVALLARERGEPELRLQLLEIPGLDLTLDSPSVRTYGSGHLLPLDELRWCLGLYLGGHPATDPLASPVLATDLAGLPPAVILTAQCDPLADDGRRYAQRLTGAGVEVRFTEHAGHVHGSHILTALLPTARAWRDEVTDAVRHYLE